MFVCFTDSLESSSIQAAKDVKAADHNEQVIANLRMQSEFISGVIDSVMFETSVVNIRAVKHHTCKYLGRKRVRYTHMLPTIRPIRYFPTEFFGYEETGSPDTNTVSHEKAWF